MMKNYASVHENVAIIEAQFREEEKLGMLCEVPLAQALKEYGADELHLAALAAIRKTDDSFRILHDGTHGVQVNPRIIVRDQMRCPGVPEARAVMQDCKSTGLSTFALKGDVSIAHRRVPVRQVRLGHASLQP